MKLTKIQSTKIQLTKTNNKIKIDEISEKIKKIEKMNGLCVQAKLKIKIYKTFQKEFHEDIKIKNHIENFENDINIYQKTIQKIIDC